jgi:hypothetical protein
MARPSRRRGVAGSSSPAGKAAPQGTAPAEPPAQQATGPADDPAALRQLAEETLRQSVAALRAARLPAHVEPAFVFKP